MKKRQEMLDALGQIQGAVQLEYSGVFYVVTSKGCVYTGEFPIWRFSVTALELEVASKFLRLGFKTRDLGRILGDCNEDFSPVEKDLLFDLRENLTLAPAIALAQYDGKSDTDYYYTEGDGVSVSDIFNSESEAAQWLFDILDDEDALELWHNMTDEELRVWYLKVKDQC